MKIEEFKEFLEPFDLEKEHYNSFIKIQETKKNIKINKKNALLDDLFDKIKKIARTMGLKGEFDVKKKSKKKKFFYHKKKKKK